MEISIYDYLSNNAKCPVCSEKSFFSKAIEGRTHQLICKQCDAVYVRDYNKKVFAYEKA